ncbi:putative glycolipid-binding domain-containing protein [Streptomyces clavuligerus]|uniref:putative glycolipid-binding domain-containing protein n=1 Tax=Streptomyces clavuligerus TaxID=1901 RepID=UPI0003115594|nr:putative glycolipid-binding domain-containing protein [Streptomyces clavuligerus]WDN55697.1 hypothetical protein LL058_01210 [Streptomyces clavuligerus]
MDTAPQSTCLTWQILDSQGLETAWVTSGPGWLAARGRAVGTVPEPYWTTYALRTGPEPGPGPGGGVSTGSRGRIWTVLSTAIWGCARSPTACPCCGTGCTGSPVSGSS